VLFAEVPVEPRACDPPPQPLEHHARGRRPQYVSHEFLFASVNDDHSTSLLMRRVFIERWRDRAGSGLSRGR
jgi:hypothetical protein